MKSAETDIPVVDRWRQYEADKRAWIVLHPGATPIEYQLAMHEIADRCGV